MAGQHILLTIQRQVVGELADDDIGQQSGPSQARSIGLATGSADVTPSLQQEQAYFG